MNAGTGAGAPPTSGIALRGALLAMFPERERRRRRLLRRLVRRFLRSPGQFLLPPRSAATEAPAHG